MTDLYLSYLLRLWRTGSAEQAVWRASLEDPHTGLRLHFASLERLFAFLEDQTEHRPVDQRALPSDADRESR